ncbi:MAG: hypothetical protein N4A43_01480 [Alphaproteobacteria bacterium]|jgi:hypothetical protein|nr:hypothetical protein [Alphaproteobacteria bacterium]
MKAELLTMTSQRWLRTLDCNQYAIRQAQSCEYLDAAFTDVIAKNPKQKDLPELLNYLNGIHKRQYADIAEVIDVPKAPNRKSYYFDSIYAGFDMDLPTMLTIQGVSYLRGQDRYRLLKGHQANENLPFVNIWKKFYQDAGTNAERTFAYVGEKFSKQFEDKLPKVLAREDAVMHNIWRHNKRNGVLKCDLS